MIDPKRLLEEYECAVQVFNSQLNDMRAIVQGGFAPSKECSDSFLRTLERLQEVYSDMQFAAKEIVPEKAVENCSVQAYAELIEQQYLENSKQANKRISLERFVAVKAISDDYRRALEPYQQAASALLEQTSMLSDDDVAGPSLFLACLETENLSGAEGETLLEKLVSLYSTKVYHGIMFRKYELSQGGEIDAVKQEPPALEMLRTDEADTAKQEDMVSEMTWANEADTLEQEAPALETTQTDEADAPEQETPAPEMTRADEADILEQEAPALETTKADETDALEQESPEHAVSFAEVVAPVFVTAIKPIKAATPSAAAFKKDVMNIPHARGILPLFTNFVALTESQIATFGVLKECFSESDLPMDRLHSTLEKMVDKNLLTSYEIESGRERIYCFTPYCSGSMQKQSIRTNRELWNGGLGKVFFEGAQEMDAGLLMRFRDSNEDLLRYLTWARDTQAGDVYHDIRRSFAWQENHYALRFPWKGTLLPCALQTDRNAPLWEGNVLFVRNGSAALPEGKPDFEPRELHGNGDVFCVWDSVLYCWRKNGWVTQAEDNEDASEASALENVSENAPVPDERFAPELVPETPREAENKPEPQMCPDDLNTQDSTPPEETAEIDIVACDAKENAKRLLRQKQPVRPEALLKLTVRLIAEERIAEAAALVETLVKAPGVSKETESFYQAFRQSVQFPYSRYRYSSDVVNQMQSALPESDPGLRSLQQAMVLSVLLWAMAFPSVAYDHDLYNNAKMAVGDAEDPTVQSLVSLLSEKLKGVSFKTDGLGFSPTVIGLLVDNGDQERKIETLRSQASTLKRTPKSTIHITGLETVLKQMVGPTSIIGRAISQIEENSTEKAVEIRLRLEEEVGLDWLASDDTLENYIDRCWNSLRKEDSHVKVRRLDNDTLARNVCKKALTERFDIIKSWLDIVHASQNDNFRQFRGDYARILNNLKALLGRLRKSTPSSAGPYEAAKWNILRRTAEKMLAVLNGAPVEEEHFYIPLCFTPELILGETGENVIVPELYGVAGLEPWSFVLRAVAAEMEEPTTILKQINEYQSKRWYRNYGCEDFLCVFTGKDHPNREQDIQQAKREAVKAVQAFKSNARLNRAYGKIQEHAMETAFSALDMVQKLYFQSNNYASFGRFLELLDGVLDREIEARAAHYEKQIQALEENFAGTELLEVIRRALEGRNFNRIDSYINQLESGVRELPESDRSMEQKMNFLAQFQDCEEGYFNECQIQTRRSKSPTRWGEHALNTMPEKFQHWTSPNERKKGCSWLNSWIICKDDSTNGARVKAFLNGLGFRVQGTPARDNSFSRAAMYEVFQVSAEKTSPRLKDYVHPIYKFGTDLSDPMYVVCLYGCKGASTLINVMTGELQFSGSTIVLMDGSLTVGDRHLVAEKFKADTSGQSPFLLIDRVLLLYLASLDEGDRQKAMLHCTLPYTFEALYGSGSGAVPEEMFIGRVSEMNDLRNEQGPSLVYGGRQLGKTALLNRASKTIHNPEKKEYSFCVDVKDEGSVALLRKVNVNLQKFGLLAEPCSDLRDLCETLQDAYEDKRLNRLQIFVDEADVLFSEFDRNDFKDLRPFILLRDNTNHHVKFVFAGTHNVAATDKADLENSNLVHMGKPLCIEPLSPGDAVKLIRIPMSYLGFEIGDSQIELILSNTNSYPGLIHMFCNALVQSVCRDYDLYYKTGRPKENPPYHISDEQMRAVFKEKDIRKEIGTRVMATIKLNQKYSIISNLLAHMVYEDRENERERLFGYSVREMLDYNQRELQIPMLNEMPERNMEALLDEMERMGILWKNSQTEQFRFCQQDFLNYIGSSEQVLELLLSEQVEGSV